MIMGAGFRFQAARRLLYLLVTTGAVAVAAPPERPLGFQQAVELTLARAPEVARSAAQIDAARAARRQAGGQRWPRLHGTFSGTRSNNPLTVFGMKLAQGEADFGDFGAGEFNPADPNVLSIEPRNLNNPQAHTNFGTQLQVDIPVYNGGKIHSFVTMADHFVQAARHGDRFARQQVLFNVLKAYEGVRAAEAFVEVAEHASLAAQAYVDMTDKMFKRGLVSKSDRLRAEVNRGDVKLKLSAARSHHANALEQLRVLAGLDGGVRIRTVEWVNATMPDTPLEQLKQQALEHNPGLVALRRTVDARRSEIKAARADYLPHFNLMLRQEWNDDNTLSGNSAYTVGGQLTWDLFDFGTRSGAVDKASAGSRQALAEARQAQQTLLVQIDKAWRDARLASERVEVREQAIAQAREAERLERLRYEQGLSTLTQLLTAQAALDKARADLAAARYQEVLQRAGLLLASGRLTAEALQVHPRVGDPACTACF